MKTWYYVVRGSEIILALVSTYLAVRSLLESSIYKTIIKHIIRHFSSSKIPFIPNPNIVELIPVILGGITFLTVLLNYIEGKPEDVIKIYELNLLMFLPEALAYSNLNWLNLLDIEEMIQPTREFTPIFLTGTVILFGYTLALTTSRDRETIQELRERGVNEGEINSIFIDKTSLNIATVTTSTLSTILIATAIPSISKLLEPLTPKLDYNYIIFGLTSSTLIILAIITYLKNRTKIS